MHRSRLAVAAASVATCVLAACSSSSTDTAARSTPSTRAPSATVTVPRSSAAGSSAVPASPPASSIRTSSAATSTATRPTPTPPTSTLNTGRSLQLPASTGNATQVVTVVASSHSSTTAELQAWNRVAGGWRPTGPEVTAHLGSGGIGQASEGSTRTPAGSFTLTQAFGHDANPGTRLPYVRTTPADWWISQSSSPLYNTRQRCASGCSFTRGDPNEHLYYETPYYDYAVVIDYNTRNAPGGVRPGAGSAFFLHVTDGGPTAGCVSVPQPRLVTILRWLRPAAHPRILIGVA